MHINRHSTWVRLIDAPDKLVQLMELDTFQLAEKHNRAVRNTIIGAISIGVSTAVLTTGALVVLNAHPLVWIVTWAFLALEVVSTLISAVLWIRSVIIERRRQEIQHGAHRPHILTPYHHTWSIIMHNTELVQWLSYDRQLTGHLRVILSHPTLVEKDQQLMEAADTVEQKVAACEAVQWILTYLEFELRRFDLTRFIDFRNLERTNRERRTAALAPLQKYLTEAQGETSDPVSHG